MKRYIRTFDGKIFDNKNGNYFLDNDRVVFHKHFVSNHPFIDEKTGVCFDIDLSETHHEYTYCGKFFKDSENILDLVEVGDLVLGVVEMFNDYGEIVLNDKLFEVEDKIMLKEIKVIKEIYTKQGRNYILVAEKKEKGWEVL